MVHQNCHTDKTTCRISHHSTAIITMEREATCIVHLKQILPARAGNVMLGLEEILVTSTYQRNDISFTVLYNKQ
jgi:hypothetical protein